MSKVKETEEKILLFPSTTEIAGVSVNVLNLARLLKSANLLDTVVCPSSGWLEDQLRHEDLPLSVLNVSYKVTSSITSSFNFLQFLRRRKEAYIIHLNGRFPTLISLPSMILFKHRRFVVTVREFADTGSAGLFGWKKWIETLIWKYFCVRISCVSEDLKKEVVRRLGKRYATKVVVIRNWIYPRYCQNFDDGKAKVFASNSELRIVAIGRLSYEKGFDVLIPAVKILMEKGYTVSCDIFGKGPEKEKLIAQISKFDLGKRIKLRGAHNNVRSLLPQYDLVIIPSRKESFGLVALEAYDAGIPVIATDIPGLRETVLSEKTGLLFRPGDPESLASQILRLVQSPNLAANLVEKGKEFVKNFYPSKLLLKQYLDFYGINHVEE